MPLDEILLVGPSRSVPTDKTTCTETTTKSLTAACEETEVVEVEEDLLKGGEVGEEEEPVLLSSGKGSSYGGYIGLSESTVVTETTTLADSSSVYGLFSSCSQHSYNDNDVEGDAVEEEDELDRSNTSTSSMTNSDDANGIIISTTNNNQNKKVAVGVGAPIVAIEEDSLSSTEVEDNSDKGYHHHHQSVNRMLQAATAETTEGGGATSTTTTATTSSSPVQRPIRQKVPSSLTIPTSSMLTPEENGEHHHDDSTPSPAIVATEEDSDEAIPNNNNNEDNDEDESNSVASDVPVPNNEMNRPLGSGTNHESCGSFLTTEVVIPDDDTIVRGSKINGVGATDDNGSPSANRVAINTSSSRDPLMSVPLSTTELRNVESSRNRPIPRRSSLKSVSSYSSTGGSSSTKSTKTKPTATAATSKPDDIFMCPPVDFNKRGSLKVLPKPDVEKLRREQIQRTSSMKAISSMPDMATFVDVVDGDSSNFNANNTKEYQRRNTVVGVTGLNGQDGRDANRISRRVSFDRIIIREHRRTMGDNPSCSYGTPISLDWEYIQHADLTLEQYEDQKRNSRIRSGGKPRTLRQLHLNHYQRRNLLQMEGYTLDQIKTQKKEINKVRKQRDMTRFIAQAPVLIKIEDIVESSKRKLFGRNNKKASSSSSSSTKKTPSSKKPLPGSSEVPAAPNQASITLKTAVASSSALSKKADELNDSNGTATTVSTSLSSSSIR